MYQFIADVEMLDADSMKTSSMKTSSKRLLREELNCLGEELVLIRRFKHIAEKEPKEPPAKRVKLFKSEEEGFGFVVSEEKEMEMEMDALCASFAKMAIV
jgi:hypothetical protein